MTRHSTDALADEIADRVLALGPVDMKAVMDRVVARVIVATDPAFQPAPVPDLLPYEPPPEPGISAEEAAARVLDIERWGECCYCEDDPRPHMHTPPWGGRPGLHPLDRETGEEAV